MIALDVSGYTDISYLLRIFSRSGAIFVVFQVSIYWHIEKIQFASRNLFCEGIVAFSFIPCYYGLFYSSESQFVVLGVKGVLDFLVFGM